MERMMTKYNSLDNRVKIGAYGIDPVDTTPELIARDRAIELSAKIEQLSHDLQSSTLTLEQENAIQREVNKMYAVRTRIQKSSPFITQSLGYLDSLKRTSNHVQNLLLISYGRKDRIPEQFQPAFNQANATLSALNELPMHYLEDVTRSIPGFSSLDSLASSLEDVAKASEKKGQPVISVSYSGKEIYRDHEELNHLPSAKLLPEGTVLKALWTEQGFEIDYQASLEASKTRKTPKSLLTTLKNFSDLPETKEYFQELSDMLEEELS